jgi:hypothetical protein
VTLERRDETVLDKPQDERVPTARRFWRPTAFELLIGLVLIVVWSAGVLVVVRHEQSGVLMTAGYVLLGVIGVAVSWLLLWPALRIMLYWMDE